MEIYDSEFKFISKIKELLKFNKGCELHRNSVEDTVMTGKEGLIRFSNYVHMSSVNLIDTTTIERRLFNRVILAFQVENFTQVFFQCVSVFFVSRASSFPSCE